MTASTAVVAVICGIDGTSAGSVATINASSGVGDIWLLRPVVEGRIEPT
ncbi:MAG TPA: hypothetical protein VN903_12475 [Polyangia bacterium]|jgi:hypothetical protein|nr:hypothetical protein [Polyangia bacterium]